MSLLDKLLAPVGTEAFFRDYFGQKGVFIKGSPEKIRLVFGALNVRQVLADSLRRTVDEASYEAAEEAGMRLSITVSGVHDGTPEGMKVPLRHESLYRGIFPPETVISILDDALAEGFLTIEGIETFCEPYAEFSRTFTAELGVPGKSHSDVLYHSFSPHRSGRGMHFDPQMTFTLGLEGTRKWIVQTQPILEWPNYAGTMTADGKVYEFDEVGESGNEGRFVGDLSTAGEEDFVAFMVEPGDLLYLPNGALHATESVDGPSVGLVFGTMADREHDIALGALKNMLDKHSLEWRPDISRNKPQKGVGSSPLHKKLVAYAGDAEGFEREHRRAYFSMLAQTPLAYVGPISTPNLGDTPPTRFRKHPSALFVVDDADMPDSGVLFAGEHEIEFDGRFVPFAQGLARESRFSLEQATQWGEPAYEVSEVLERLNLLIELGVLVVDG